VLTQLDDNGWEFVVAYANWCNNKTKAKYSSYERECLVIIWAIFSFKCYLYGNPFTLVIDHQPLKFLMESNRPTRKLARWALIFQEYDFNIVHKANRVNQDVDGLSRNPSSSEENTIGARWHGEVDLEVVPGWHASTHLCTLLGCSGDVHQGNTSIENSFNDGDELEDNGALDIHLNLLVMAYLQVGEVPLGLTPKEWDRVVDKAK
jgi:hypothetical protein